MGIEIGTLAAIAAIAGGASTVYNAVTQKKSQTPTPPPPPPAPVTFQDPQIAQGGDMARRRAIAAGGIMSNIATGPEGLTGPASTTGKSLLGQ